MTGPQQLSRLQAAIGARLAEARADLAANDARAAALAARIGALRGTNHPLPATPADAMAALCWHRAREKALAALQAKLARILAERDAPARRAARLTAAEAVLAERVSDARRAARRHRAARDLERILLALATERTGRR